MRRLRNELDTWHGIKTPKKSPADTSHPFVLEGKKLVFILFKTTPPSLPSLPSSPPPCSSSSASKALNLCETVAIHVKTQRAFNESGVE